MRSNDDVLLACNGRICEVGYILCNLSAFQCSDHRRLIHQDITCKVQEYHTVLHHADGISIDHTLGRIQKRYMDGNEIAAGIDIVHICDVLYGTGQTPCSIYGYERVITVNFHTETNTDICNLGTDGTQADNTQLLACDLAACEVLFLLLSGLADVLIGCICGYPVCTADDIAGGQQHTCNHQFLNAVCVCARCIEDYDSLLCALVQRNVVHAGTCTCYSQKLVRQFHLVHGCAADQNSLCISVITYCIILSQKIQTAGCDRIQALYLSHDHFSYFFYVCFQDSSPLRGSE